MMYNHHGTKVNYTRNILSNMHYMFSVIAILLILSGIELLPDPIDKRTFFRFVYIYRITHTQVHEQ
jgi:hypothetical protein